MSEFDKQELLTALKARLLGELERVRNRAREAADGATHEENRAEGDKDMRATEASYIARGHAERAAALEAALARLSSLSAKPLKPGARIETPALVELSHDGRSLHYFLVPAAGGERLVVSGAEIQTITPTSPLGAVLLGLVEGDEAELPARGAGPGERRYEVLKVR